MEAFSQDNHLKYGFTEKFLSYQPNSIFHIGVGDIVNQPKSLKQECENACKDIYKRAEGKKIFVALSGGVDSECVLRSFTGANVPVHAAILKFNDELNWHDTDVAVQLCERLGVAYTLIDLNLFDFYSKNLHLKYAEQFRLSSPMIATHIYLAERIIDELNGVPVFAGDIARLDVKQAAAADESTPVTELVNQYYALPSNWSCPSFVQQDHLVLDQMFHKKKQFGVSNFYFYTPAQVASSIALGLNSEYKEFEFKLLMKSIARQKDAETFYAGQVKLTQTKEMLFQMGGFTPDKHISKWTGFELFHSCFADGKFINGRTLDLTADAQKKIIGMTMYNEKYRKPMKEIAKQLYLKRILMSPKLFRFVAELISSRKAG